MGLKNTNYISKSTGVVLPQAYAVLTNLILEKNNKVRAIFAIQSSRENTQTYKPLDTCEIHFEWDRKSDIAVIAYEIAKTETKEVVSINESTGEQVRTVEFGLLYGWQDDIL